MLEKKDIVNALINKSSSTWPASVHRTAYTPPTEADIHNTRAHAHTHTPSPSLLESMER